MNLRESRFQKFKKWAVRTFGLATGSALAYVWLVIAILVLVVGAYIVVKLLQTIKHVLPPDAPKGVLRIQEQHEDHSFWWAFDSLAESPNIESQAVESPTPWSFSINYVLDSNKVPWISIGLCTNAVNADTISISEASATDESNYTYRVTGEGSDVRITYVDGVLSSELLSSTDGTDATNSFQTIIERSTNLADWILVGTNSGVQTNSVQNFTDTDALVPPANAFYRVRVIVPTNSVDSATNSVGPSTNSAVDLEE